MKINGKIGLSKLGITLISILVFILIISFSYNAIAGSAVKINPTNPLITDNLLCTVNGKTAGFNFHWTGTGVVGGKVINVNPLPASLTQLGKIKCEAYAQIPNSPSMGTYTVTITNSKPVINPLIPDQEILENSGLNSGLVNLWNYVSDVESQNNELNYSIVSETGLNIVDCSIRSNETGAWVDCTTLPNMDGYSDITVRVTDNAGAFSEDVFRVTVLHRNQLPVIDLLPDVTICEDSGLNEHLIDLWDYTDDPDQNDDELSFRVVSQSNIAIADCNVISDRWIDCDTQPNQFGTSDIVIEVNDGYGAVDTDEFTLTVNPVNDAPMVSNTIPDVQMYEDMPDTAAPTIDLDDFVFDVDNSNSDLTWTATSDVPEVNVLINSDNTLSYNLSQDYYGHATVTLTACDLGPVNNSCDTATTPLCSSEDIFLTILPVNDAPIVDGIPNVSFDEDTVYTTSWSLNDYITDVDDPISQITWTASGNNYIHVIINDDGTLTFSAPENWNGEENVTFTATDLGLLSDNYEITVNVNPVNDAPVITPIVYVEFNEDSSTTLNLNMYTSDVDNTLDELSFNVLSANNIIVNIDPVTHIANFSAPADWNGEENVTIEVSDGLLSDQDTFLVRVLPVPDAPLVNIVNPIDGLNFICGEPITFDGNYTDVDELYEGDTISLTWMSSEDGTIASDTGFSLSNLTCDADHTITLLGTDSYGETGTDEVTIHVNANQAPVVTITEPVNTNIMEYCSIDFSAIADDPDSPYGYVLPNSWRWQAYLSNGTSSALSNKQNFTSDMKLPLGNNFFTASVVDNYGDLGSSTIVINTTENEKLVLDYDVVGYNETSSDYYEISQTNHGVSLDLNALILSGDNDDLTECGCDINDYTWIWKDNGESLSDSQSITADLDVGLHDITLTAVDCYGDAAENIAEFTVNVTNQAPVVNDVVCYNGNDDSTNLMELEPIYCEGTASDPNNDDMTTWIWNVLEDDSDETVLYEGTSSTFNLPELLVNGTYTVTARAIDDLGAVSDAFNFTINILNNAPVVTLIADPQTGTEPLDVNFVCNVTGGNADYIFDFDFITGNLTTSSTSVTENNIYSFNGTYNPICTVTDIDGDVASATVPIIVDDAVPTADFYYDPLNPMENETISFYDNSTSYDAIVDYLWDFGDNSTSNLQDPTHTYLQNGIYTVTLTVTDSDGSTDSVSYDINVNDTIPTAAIVAPENVVENNTAQFVGFGTGYDQPLTYDWDFGDNSTGTGQIANHIYAQQGNYTVTLTVTDADGSTATSTHLIEVYDTIPTAEAGADQFATEGISIQLDGSNSTGYDQPLTYDWDFGDGTTGTGSIINHTYLQNGIYTVTLTVTDADGSTDTDTLVVSVADTIPTANFTFTPVNPDESLTPNVQFDGTLSTGYDQTLNYTWNFGDGTTGTGSTIDHAYQTTAVNSANETFTVTLTVTDSDGSTSVYTQDIIVNDLAPTSIISVSNQNPTEMEEVTFDGTGSTTPVDSIVAYQWNFGDGTTGTSQIVNHTYSINGTYTASLTVIDSDGSQDTNTIPITVGNNAPIVNVVANQTSGLEPSSITYTCSATGGNYPLTFNFDFGNGVSDVITTSTTNTVNFTTIYNNGTYNGVCTVTDADGDVGTGSSLLVTILDGVPTADFYYDPLNPMENETISFYDNSTSGSTVDTLVSYEWNFGDGNTSNLQNPTYVYPVNGIYTVTLTVTDSDGSTDSVSHDVIVGDIVPVPGIVAPDNTTENETIQVTGYATSYDPITDWNWDFGNGDTATGQVVSYTYPQNGNYTITLTVTDSDGSTATSTHLIEVYDTIPIVNFTFNPEYPLEGDNVNFTDLSGAYDMPISWNWDFGDGTTDNSQNPSHIYALSGIYNINLTVTDADGSSVSLIKPIAVGDIDPVANFTFVDNQLECNPVSFTDTSVSVDGIANYSWDFGDGDISTLQNPTHSYHTTAVNSANETFTVTLTITEVDGDISTITKQITILDSNPTANILSPLNNSVFNEGTNVTFDGSSSSAGASCENLVSYQWNFGDGTTGTGPTLDHIYSINGTYTATLTVIDEDGSQDVASINVVIGNDVPSVVLITNPIPTQGPEPFIVNFTCSVVSGTGNEPYIFNFDFGNGMTDVIPSTTMTSASFTGTYMDNGTYTATCSVTDSDGDTGSEDTLVTVDDVDPTAVILGTFPMIINSGDSVTFDGSNSTSGSSSDLISSYDWDFGDGTTGTGDITSHTFTGNSGDTFNVTLTVYDEDSSDSETVQIIINGAPTVVINSPLDNSNYCYDASGYVSFDGTANDPEDGALSGEWFYKLQGVSGDGTSFGNGDNVNLDMSLLTSGNSYTISLIGVDSLGARGVSNVNINLIDCPLKVNEFTVDPQTDWDSSGTVGSSDEWFEIYNPMSYDIDLTGLGWTLSLEDSTSEVQALTGLVPADGYLVILNPTGVQNNDGAVRIINEFGNVVDEISYGSFGTGPNGNSNNVNDECISRVPNGIDTDNDAIDFVKQACTYGSSNDFSISADLSAPIISNIDPVNGSTISSPLILSLDTDENATCEYSTTQTFAYGTGTPFTTTGGLSHSITLGLVDGDYTYYVKCQDVSGNANDNSNQGITSFTVSSAVVNNPPVANAGPDQNVNTGTLVQLDGSLSTDDGSITSYSWTITSSPAGSTATITNPNSVNPTIIPDIAGTYTIELTVYDNGIPSLSDTDSVDLIATAIVGNNAPVVTITNPNNGDAFTIGSLPSGVLGDLNGDGVITSVDRSMIVILSLGGSTDCYSDFNDPSGSIIDCMDVADLNGDGIINQTDIDIIQGILLVPSNTILFNGNANDPEEGILTGTSLTWTSNIDGILGTGNSLSIDNLSDGTHLITLTACDSQSLCTTDSITIYVNVLPPALNQSNLYGTVADGIGNNIYDSDVQVYQGSTLVTSTTTDDTGYYTFSNLVSGVYNVVVSKLGFITQTITNTLSPGDNNLNINIIQNNTIAGRVSGTVKDVNTGLGIDTARVNIYDTSNNLIQVIYTDSLGNFIATGLPAITTYTLEAEKTGYLLLNGASTPIVNGSTVTDQIILMA